jgi:bacillithiol biosynthesis cysteine-adding enzyme BshC
MAVEYERDGWHGLALEDLSGVLPVKAECLPFSQIPHTTKLFADFISNSPNVQKFYPRSAHFTKWMKDEAGKIQYDPARRERVAAILERQNRAWGASSKTLENIARFRAGASAVLTGQQVVLFGGPAFSIYKALTAVKLADQATQAGIDAVPIFWLATEDHDLAEVNHVSVPGQTASLQKLAVSTQGATDAPVGTIAFGSEIEDAVAEAVALLGETEVAQFLGESYRPGDTFGSAFAKLFTRLFAEWGIVLLDPMEPEFHSIAAPILHNAIERAGALDESLLARGKALESAGYHQQVKVTPASTLLFAIRDGVRTPIHRKANGTEEVFVIGDMKIPQAELLRQIDEAPEDFSANVLLRPVMQDYLLPTLTYTGGAAEVAYFAQDGVVYEALLGRVTPVLPRFSASIIEEKSKRLLEHYGLALPDLFQGPEIVRERLAGRVLPKEIQEAFDRADQALDESLAEIREALARLDKTLVESAGRSASKMQYQIRKLRSRANRAELRRNEVVARHADMLSNALYPNKTLQEREIAGIYFVSAHGRELLRSLYDTIHTDCIDHQVISL